MATDVFLFAGVLAQLICCVGLASCRTVFDRLHYAGAGSTLGPILIGLAIVLRHGFKAEGLDTIAAVALLSLLSPIAIHAIARAARRAELGQVEALPAEIEAFERER